MKNLKNLDSGIIIEEKKPEQDSENSTKTPVYISTTPRLIVNSSGTVQKEENTRWWVDGYGAELFLQTIPINWKIDTAL